MCGQRRFAGSEHNIALVAFIPLQNLQFLSCCRWPLLTACQECANEQVPEPSASTGPCEQVHEGYAAETSYSVLVREGCKRAFSCVKEQLEMAIGAGIEKLQHLVAMPRMHISRRSALRFRVQWRGVTQPQASHETLF